MDNKLVPPVFGVGRSSGVHDHYWSGQLQYVREWIRVHVEHRHQWWRGFKHRWNSLRRVYRWIGFRWHGALRNVWFGDVRGR